jgi:hypothetical protein
VLNPGGANEETAIVLSSNPLQLKDPLLFAHDAGEMVAAFDTTAVDDVEPTPTPTATPTPGADNLAAADRDSHSNGYCDAKRHGNSDGYRDSPVRRQRRRQQSRRCSWLTSRRGSACRRERTS